MARRSECQPAAGRAEPGSTPATLTFVSPTNDNLFGAFNQVYVTQGAEAEATTNNQNVVLAGTLPEKALVHIRHVLFSIGNTLNKIGFALGLRQETGRASAPRPVPERCAASWRFPPAKPHAEHIANIIKGSEAKDLNGDSKVQNPGDGFGLLQNGTR
ncbi:MAG: hypothetical protein U0074_02715 [Kouleothrix sp.]